MKGYLKTILLTFTVLSCCLIGRIGQLQAQSNDDCLLCHEDPQLTGERDGKNMMMFVNASILKKSVHRNVTCASCHKDVGEDFPHNEKLAKVDCGSCHSGAKGSYNMGAHGMAFARNDEHAPTCVECHGKHDILSSTNPTAVTYKMNIPVLCGKCHREGAPVARLYNVSEHNILENYSESIHGKGLFESGLIVSATCNDCHGNHMVLPHNSPKSTVSIKNIASTCMKCHARIENVHKKVINRELWEKSPGAVPACSSCHPSHKISIVKDSVNINDKVCLDCHLRDDVFKTENGVQKSLKIDPRDLAGSVHYNIPCVKCHADVTVSLKRPCETAKKIDCGNCHTEVNELYIQSGHGQAFFNKTGEAPYCIDCHGSHIVKSKTDDTSPVYRTAVPKLCGECHKKDGKAVKHTDLKEVNAFMDYSSSVHGRSLTEKGLLNTAICTDCHTAHFVLKEADVASSVNPMNIPATCGKCHKGIYDQYIKSDHSITINDGKNYPTCAKCHSAHLVSEIDETKFMSQITYQCGECHKNVTETYFETYHGKVYRLGYMDAAKCSDCHEAHYVLKVDNPNSAVGKNNILATCRKCHPAANEQFTGYLTHATHNDKENHPELYYVYWAMTGLLLSVFAFFGLHTLLWLPRSLKERKKHPKIGETTKYFRRFEGSHRVTHIFVIISFVFLALTGMILKFSDMAWAKFMANLFGGVTGAGTIHRIGAIITFGYFTFHIFNLFRLMFKRKATFKDFFFGPNSLMFSMRDVTEFIGTVKWFVGKGERPKYGRWTYWEKFDYMAVFWGVAVIGFSGLVLWFSEFFTNLLPGWVINVSQIIHSDEALMAVGFIFTVHFFNTHLRPEAFPMDTVIFTGHVPLEIYEHERPRDIEELEKAGKLEDRVVEKVFTSGKMKVIKTFGFLFVAMGVILIILIIYSLLS